MDGRVWCVTVPPHHLVIVRRAMEFKGDIVHAASLPIIIGQCFQAGMQCTSACKCSDCKNGKCDATDDQDGDDTAPTHTHTHTKKSTVKGRASNGTPPPRPSTAPSTSNGTVEAKPRSYKKMIATSVSKQEAAALAAAAAAKSEYAAINAAYKKQSAHNGVGQSSGSESDASPVESGPVRREKTKPKSKHLPHKDPLSTPLRTSHSMEHQFTSPVTPATVTSASTSSSSDRHPPMLTSLNSNMRVTAGGRNGKSASVPMIDAIETDTELTCSDNSLQEAPQSVAGAHPSAADHVHVLATPVKSERRGVKRPAGGSMDVSNTNFSALATLSEVASPSPRARHVLSRQSYMHGFGLSPVSPISVLHTPTNPNKRSRTLTYRTHATGAASPLPPLFSPLRHPNQSSSPFPSGLISPGASNGSHLHIPMPLLQLPHHHLLHRAMHSPLSMLPSTTSGGDRILPSPNGGERLTSDRTNGSHNGNGNGGMNGNAFSKPSTSSTMHHSTMSSSNPPHSGTLIGVAQ